MADDPLVDGRGGAPFVEPQAAFRDRFQRAMDCVCRVDIEGRAAGTGFLVGRSTVLTNFHVIEPALRDSVLTEVSCFFDFVALPSGGMHTGPRIDVVELLAHSPYGLAEKIGRPLEALRNPPELDFALLQLSSDQGLSAAPGSARARGWLPLPADVPRITLDSALHIVQHPAGGPAWVASNPQGIRRFSPDRPDRLVHGVRTEAGSSGSGCFNERWELVALHNYGDPAWGNPVAAYGRGVPVHLVRAEIIRQAPRADIPADVATEDVDSVAAILRTLAEALRSDGGLTARVGRSRAVLEEIATCLQYLDAYKALHDFLHEVQKTEVRFLRALIQLAGSDETVHAVADALAIKLKDCREVARRTRPDGSESERRQLEWIDGMAAAALRLGDGANAESPRDLVDQVRRIARQRMVRLNNALVAEACDIDLNELGRVLRDTLVGLRLDGGAAEVGSLERLSLELDRLVTEHQFWQGLENDLQGLDDKVRGGGDVIDREAFHDLWRACWRQVQEACERDFAASWAVDLLAVGGKVEALVADRAWDGVGRAFGDFSRPALERFFQVDKALLTHCQAIGQLGDPLQSLLRLV